MSEQVPGETRKADPAIYPKLRENALRLHVPNLAEDAIHAVLMDWPLSEGMLTVLAAVDGAASLYLSSGGGFIGGGQRHVQLNQQARQAVGVAQTSRSEFRPVTTYPLPAKGYIAFYVTTSSGVYAAQAIEDDLKSGRSPLATLGGVMQAIITSYRTLPMGQAKSLLN